MQLYYLCITLKMDLVELQKCISNEPNIRRLVSNKFASKKCPSFKLSINAIKNQTGRFLSRLNM